MFWVELYLVFQMALWFVLGHILNLTAGERSALTIFLALGIKSILLFTYISLGLARLFPSPVIFTVVVFILYFAWIKLRPLVYVISPAMPLEERGLFGYFGFLILFILFILSAINAWVFPITGADGIWHHVKGMVYSQTMANFESEQIIAQFRQYPPLIGLIYGWLLNAGFERISIIFPILYLCLLVIVFYRVQEHTTNSIIAGAATLLVGTTPYLWWHSFLPFLDWTAGVFYALGVFYWFLLIKDILRSTKNTNRNQNKSLAILSGLLFGFASWTRPEFLLYSILPLFLMVYIFDREEKLVAERNPIIARFAIAALILPSLWFAVILNFNGPLDGTFKQLIMACAGLWIGLGLVLSGVVRVTPRIFSTIVLFAIVIGLVGLFFALPPKISPWNAITIRLFRLFSVHIFFIGTILLVVLLFSEKLLQLPLAEKILGILLLLFPLVQLFIYAYAGLKWPTLSHFISNTFILPGNSINLSDTRGTIGFYPILVFFIFCLPKIRTSINSKNIRRFLFAIITINLIVISIVFAGPRIKFMASNFDKPYKQLSEITGPFDLPNQFIKTYKVAHQIQKYVLKDQHLFLPPGTQEGTFRSVMTQVLFWNKLTFADDSHFWEDLKQADSRAYVVSLNDKQSELCHGVERKSLGDTGFSLCRLDKFSKILTVK